MRVSLRNIKMVFSVDYISPEFQNLFQPYQHNLILRMSNSVILTIYLSQIKLKRIHITGLKRRNQKKMLLNFFKSHGIEVNRVEINNSFFLLKNINIPEYNKFAFFCSMYKRKGVKIDLSSFNSHENFLSVIYMRVLYCTGVANIHRKSVILLACRKKCCVEKLKVELGFLLTEYATSLLKNKIGD